MLLKIKGRDHTIKDTGLPETRAANVQLTLRVENALLHILFHREVWGGQGGTQATPYKPVGGEGRSALGSATGTGPCLSLKVTNEAPGELEQGRHV